MIKLQLTILLQHYNILLLCLTIRDRHYIYIHIVDESLYFYNIKGGPAMLDTIRDRHYIFIDIVDKSRKLTGQNYFHGTHFRCSCIIWSVTYIIMQIRKLLLPKHIHT